VSQTSDINVSQTLPLPTPRELMAKLPKSDAQRAFVARGREEIHRIIFGDDKRLLLVVGPCSIHDVDAGRAYAEKLAGLAARVSDRLLPVMRVYFEKPRTSVGWKGLVMDPDLDDSSNIAKGLEVARRFLSDVIDLGLPTATELLDPITPQYIADLVSWAAIGARTTESQTHRQMASGLSMPLGFKNGTDGSIHVAINAIKAARHPQTFLGIDREGRASSVTTRGNPNCHVVLRGGKDGPNCDPASVKACADALAAAGLPKAVMIDCSHDNSGKRPERQPEILEAVARQVADGESAVIGAMVESNLRAGSQPFPSPKGLRYGVSITDACIDWETTERCVLATYERLAQRFAAPAAR